MTLPSDEIRPEEPRGELVHWMAPGRLRVGATGMSATAAAGFALGVLATVGVFAALRWRSARREELPPWRWGRGRLH